MVEELFLKNGPIARGFLDYEERPEQIEMARNVEDAILNGKYLICEAGTGVGKSLAYLVPFVYWAKSESKRVIISTYTKTLQYQLLNKDIPLLQSVLPIKFRASVAVGSENYLCLRRWQKLVPKGFLLPSVAKDVEYIAEWEAGTKTGLRDELERVGKVKIFDEVARIPDLCIGRKCALRGRCYYELARKRLFKSDIIVANHWLFFANIVSGKRVLPPYHGVVFDEAQNIENVASEYFGVHFSNYKVSFFLNLLRREIKEKVLNRAIDEADAAKEEFFRKIITILGDKEVIRIRQQGIAESLISPHFNTISKVLKELKKVASDEEEAAEIGCYASKCKDLDAELGIFLNQADPDAVYWIERSKRIKRRRIPVISLNTAPIVIAPLMKKYVFSAGGGPAFDRESEVPTVLTSATLTVDRSFEFLSKRLGLEDKQEVQLHSSFDYKKQAILYIPKIGPDPRAKTYKGFVGAETVKILEITQGRALVLFTSFKLMDEVYEFVRKRLSGCYLKQGEASRDELLRRFRKKPATLFGVATFWQGVDVPGEALIAVVITRLPFEVPDSPLTEARTDWIREHGGDPFWEYQLPQAVMVLKQGFGRLIRKHTDFGLIAILDTRIRRKAYGIKFLNSLPECKLTSSLKEVKDFHNW